MKYLITGAAGFIGSNLVETLLNAGHEVVGVDNFITGKRENIEPFAGKLKFIEGDLRELEVCRSCCQGVDYALHQAALGSVPRSVADPLTTHQHNADATLNLLVAARESGVKRLVYAASSSAYGETATQPKIETLKSIPLSPYAVSKLCGEMYAHVFSRNYGIETVALRYFNVFGPRQDPAGMYAAVIPKFIMALKAGRRPVIYGDGEQTRDFTYVENVVQANMKACEAGPEVAGEVFNIGAGGRVSVNNLFNKIAELLGSNLKPIYEPARNGDILHSQASIAKAEAQLGYAPEVNAFAGLERAIDWYKANFNEA